MHTTPLERQWIPSNSLLDGEEWDALTLLQPHTLQHLVEQEENHNMS